MQNSQKVTKSIKRKEDEKENLIEKGKVIGKRKFYLEMQYHKCLMLKRKDEVQCITKIKRKRLIRKRLIKEYL